MTLDELFEQGSFRVHEDLYLLSDQVFGWDTDYGILRDAGVEACERTRARTRGRTRTVWDELAKAQFRASPPNATRCDSRTLEAADRRGRREAVAGAQRGRADSRTGRLDLAAGPQHPTGLDVAYEWHFAFDHPRAAAAFRAIRREGRQPLRCSPRPHGNARLALRSISSRAGSRGRGCGSCSDWSAIACARPRGWPTLGALALAAFAVVFLNALGLFADLHFVLPVAPAFVLLGLGGLLGARGPSPQ